MMVKYVVLKMITELSESLFVRQIDFSMYSSVSSPDVQAWNLNFKLSDLIYDLNHLILSMTSDTVYLMCICNYIAWWLSIFKKFCGLFSSIFTWMQGTGMLCKVSLDISGQLPLRTGASNIFLTGTRILSQTNFDQVWQITQFSHLLNP